jgi:Cft2 family RNA processing exonuclease
MKITYLGGADAVTGSKHLAGTRGGKLVIGATDVKIHGEYVPVKASVSQIEGLSAHADANGLMAWMRGFTRQFGDAARDGRRKAKVVGADGQLSPRAAHCDRLTPHAAVS